MQFHIPQYIDIEDKLIGPLTLKQAIYVAGGLGAAYLVFRLIPYIVISGPIILAIGTLTWALGFYPKEKLGKPFIEILEAGFSYALSEKLYTWKKTTKERKLGAEEDFISAQGPLTPSIRTGTLSSKLFTLDVRGPTQEEERELGRRGDDFLSTKILPLVSSQPKNLSSASFGTSGQSPEVKTGNSPHSMTNISSTLKSLNLHK